MDEQQVSKWKQGGWVDELVSEWMSDQVNRYMSRWKKGWVGRLVTNEYDE